MVRYHRLDKKGQMNGRTERQTDGQTDRWMYGRKDGQMDRQMDGWPDGWTNGRTKRQTEGWMGDNIMDGLIHFFKHLIGLCGEAHPSLIMGGGVFLTSLGIWRNQIIMYIKDLF